MQRAEIDRNLSQSLLLMARGLPPRRLTRIEFRGKPYFVKKPEQHASLRWRMQKGNPDTAFAREMGLLHDFAAKGAAVPQIVAAQSDCMIMADHGTPMQRFIIQGQADAELMQRTGKALAELHALGLAHGRPSLRDICWNGKELTFLDLEAGATVQATPRDQARDLFLLLHSVFLTDGAASSLAAPLLDAYRAQGDAAVWAATQSRARGLWWLELLTRPGAWLHHWRGKKRCEFAAIRAARALIARG